MTMEDANLKISYFCRNARLSLQKAAFSKKSYQLSEELEQLRNFEVAVSKGIQGHPLYEANKGEKEIMELEYYLPDVRKRLEELEGKHPFLARHVHNKGIVASGGAAAARIANKSEKTEHMKKKKKKGHHNTITAAISNTRLPSSSSATSATTKLRPLPHRTSSAPPPQSPPFMEPRSRSTRSPFFSAKHSSNTKPKPNPSPVPAPPPPPCLHRSCSPSARDTSPESISFRKFKQSLQKKNSSFFFPTTSSPSPPSPSPSSPLRHRNTVTRDLSPPSPSPSSSKKMRDRKDSKAIEQTKTRPPSAMEKDISLSIPSRIEDLKISLRKSEFLLLDADEDHVVNLLPSFHQTCAYDFGLPSSQTPAASSSDGDYLSWRTKRGLMKKDEECMPRDVSRDNGDGGSEDSDTGSIGFSKNLQERQGIQQDEEGVFHMPVDDFSEEKYRMVFSNGVSSHPCNDYGGDTTKVSPFLQNHRRSSTPSSYSRPKEAADKGGSSPGAVGDGFQELESALEQFHFGESSHCNAGRSTRKERKSSSRGHHKEAAETLTENLEEALRRLRGLQDSDGSLLDAEKDTMQLLDEVGNRKTRSIAAVDPSSIVDQLLNDHDDDIAYAGNHRTTSASSSAAYANSRRTLTFGEEHRNDFLASRTDHYLGPGDGVAAADQEQNNFKSFSDEKIWERWGMNYNKEEEDAECGRDKLRGKENDKEAETRKKKSKKKKNRDKTVKFESWKEGGSGELAAAEDEYEEDGGGGGDGDGDEESVAALLIEDEHVDQDEEGGGPYNRSSSLGTGDDDDAVSRLRKLQVKRFMGEDECTQHKEEEEDGDGCGYGYGDDDDEERGMHRKPGFTMTANSFTKPDALSSSSSSASSQPSCTPRFRVLQPGSGRVSPSSVAFWDHYSHLHYLSSDVELYQKHHRMGTPTNIPHEATFCNPVFDFDSNLSSKALSDCISRQMFGLCCDAEDGVASSPPLPNGAPTTSAAAADFSNFLSQEHVRSMMSKIQAELKDRVEEAVAESMKKFEASLKIDSELKRLHELGNQIKKEIKSSLHEGRGHSSQRRERELEAIVAESKLEKRLSQLKDTVASAEKEKLLADMKDELFSTRKESAALKVEMQGRYETMNQLMEEIRSKLDKDDKRYRDVKDSFKEQMQIIRKEGMECRYLLDGMKRDTDEQMRSMRRTMDELNAQGVQQCKAGMENLEKLLHEEQLNSKHMMENLEESWKQWRSDIDALKQFRDDMEGETGALRCDALLRNLVQNLVDSWKEDHSEFEALKRFKDDVEKGRIVSKNEIELKSKIEELERSTKEDYCVLRESLSKFKDELKDGKKRISKSEEDMKCMVQSLERSWKEGNSELEALNKLKKDLEEGRSMLKSEAETRTVLQDLERSWKEGWCEIEALKKFKKDVEEGRSVLKSEALIMERVEGLSQLYLGGLDDVRTQMTNVQTQFQSKLEELSAKHRENSLQTTEDSIKFKISLSSLETRIFELEKGHHTCSQILQERAHDILADAGKHSKSAAAFARAAEDSLAKLSKLSKLQDSLVSDREASSCLLLELRNMNADARNEREASLAAATTAKKKIQEVLQDFETELERLRMAQSKADKEKNAIASMSEEISGSATKARNMVLEMSELRQKSVQISEELLSELNQTKWEHTSANHRSDDMYRKVLSLEGSQLDLSRKLEEFSDKTEELERSVAEWVPKYDAAARVLNEVESRLGMLEATGRSEIDCDKRLAELDDRDGFVGFSTSHGRIAEEEQLRWSPLDSKRNSSSMDTREKGKTLDTRIIILESRIEHVASATYTNLRILDTKVEHINGYVEKAIKYATVAEKKCNIMGAELVKVFRMLAKSGKSNPQKLCRSPSTSADSDQNPKFTVRRKSPLSTATSKLKKHIPSGDTRTCDLGDVRISVRGTGTDDKECAANKNGKTVDSSSRGKSQHVENDNRTKTAGNHGVEAGSKNAFSGPRCTTEDDASSKSRRGNSSDKLNQNPKLQDSNAASDTNDHDSPRMKTHKADFHLDSGRISVNVSHRSRLFK